MNVLVRKLNSARFRYREHRWRWDPRFRRDDPTIQIDRPIFLLGIGGGGLTLTARILKRMPGIVSATGNHRYWAGNDEMQNVLHGHLQESFGWRSVRVAGFHDRHDNVYGCDALYDYYHEDASDATDAKREHFRSTLRRLIRLNRASDYDGPVRFIDKSQTFTLRIGLIQEVLNDTRPKFVLITRDPFAMCWRGVRVAETLADLDKSEEEKMAISVQHWKNNMENALAFEKKVDLATWRFEDLLADPGRVIHEICDFAELRFSPDILPGPNDAIPWGSAYDAFDRRKWYPLRADVNRRYLAEIPSWAARVVRGSCGPLLERFRYDTPSG